MRVNLKNPLVLTKTFLLLLLVLLIAEWLLVLLKVINPGEITMFTMLAPISWLFTVLAGISVVQIYEDPRVNKEFEGFMLGLLYVVGLPIPVLITTLDSLSEPTLALLDVAFYLWMFTVLASIWIVSPEKSS